MDTEYDKEADRAKVTSNFQTGYDQLKTLIAAGETFAKTDNIKMLHRAHMDMLGLAVRMSQDSYFGLMVLNINEQVQAAKDKQMAQHHIDAHPVPPGDPPAYPPYTK